MSLLTRQNIVEAGLTPTFSAAAGGGDTVSNTDGKTYLHVKNGGGGSITVTITAQTVTKEDPHLGTLTRANIAKVVANGAEAIIGPIKKQSFNNASDIIAITYSGVTSVTVAALWIEY
jgi:hypothetical protein